MVVQYVAAVRVLKLQMVVAMEDAVLRRALVCRHALTMTAAMTVGTAATTPETVHVAAVAGKFFNLHKYS